MAKLLLKTNHKWKQMERNINELKYRKQIRADIWIMDWSLIE